MSPQTPRGRPSALKRIFSGSNNRSSSRMSSRTASGEEKPSSSLVEMAQKQAMGTLTGPDKLNAVTELMGKLKQDLDTISLLPHQRDAVLEELKIYGRDPKNADPIYTKDGIETLTRHAFNSPSSTTARNALRCICNAMLLKAETRQIFVNLGFESRACAQLKNDNRDDEFLISRVLFLTTYGTNTNILELIDKHHLDDIIIKNLERHCKHRQGQKLVTEPMEDIALTETLKLMFNITHYCKDRTSSFTPAIPHIVNLLCKVDFTASKPLDPPISTLVNGLLNLDVGAKEVQSSLYPQEGPNVLADRLLDILVGASTTYSNDELESLVTALIGVIRAVHEYAPEEVKASIRRRLLPTEKDRNEVLGRSGTISSWLLRNSTNPVTPQLRNAISDLLFDMSDKDASKFVDNVGYGFASGFLFNRNIPIPQSASEAFANAGGSSRPVNPVTGQFLDSERHPAAPEMSQEEKEREAERLYVLFERLRANGIISAENPVRIAQQEGRFEELPDNYDEDVD
ncbi:guanine nucleotide exchange factor [Pseudomassariella vexata]|uniref:Guanine nucleotide exchange factor n=1 Tax=Pseudomassariella vexata TaxID=1141098 RepID=A0A1Y2DCY8_9PEZI|nr:guanine nucleotide exchange factor [Pseudomassariella vexata]ORY57142.1 guanine nucleotide exchange factor [Pseudomassariella vexata]